MKRFFRSTVSGVVVMLFLISVLTAFNVQTVEASSQTIYIKADGSIDPPTAPISSVDNVTYTFTGSIINNSIVVERDNIVVDGAGYTLQGNGTGIGIDLSGRSNVTIKDTEIKSFDDGIYLLGSSNNTVSGNNITNNTSGIRLSYSSNNIASGNDITNNWRGIWLDESSNNTINGNNITESISDGIDLWDSSGNTVSENTITGGGVGIDLWRSSNNTVSGNNITENNYSGIELGYSSNNTLRNNDASKNEYNFGVRGSLLSEYIHDIDDSNTVDGKPVYYWVDRRDMAVPLDAGYVALINCTSMTVQNLDLTNNGQGVLLAFTTNSTITNNNITNNSWGIYLPISSNNTVSGNNITNSYYGIELRFSSNNKIYHNDFIKNYNQVRGHTHTPTQYLG